MDIRLSFDSLMIPWDSRVLNLGEEYAKAI